MAGIRTLPPQTPTRNRCEWLQHKHVSGARQQCVVHEFICCHGVMICSGDGRAESYGGVLKNAKPKVSLEKGNLPRRWHVIRTLCKKLTVDHRNSFCFWFLPHWRLLPVMFSDDVIPVESGVDVAGWSRGVRRSKKSRYNLLETTTCDSFVL